MPTHALPIKRNPRGTAGALTPPSPSANAAICGTAPGPMKRRRTSGQLCDDPPATQLYRDPTGTAGASECINDDAAPRPTSSRSSRPVMTEAATTTPPNTATSTTPPTDVPNRHVADRLDPLTAHRTRRNR
jgi:hypothetical protein